MKNCKQIATEWGLSERTVNDLCKKNKIDGAIKVGKCGRFQMMLRSQLMEESHPGNMSDIQQELQESHYLLAFLIMSEHRQIITM